MTTGAKWQLAEIDPPGAIFTAVLYYDHDDGMVKATAHLNPHPMTLIEKSLWNFVFPYMDTVFKFKVVGQYWQNDWYQPLYRQARLKSFLICFIIRWNHGYWEWNECLHIMICKCLVSN